MLRAEIDEWTAPVDLAGNPGLSTIRKPRSMSPMSNLPPPPPPPPPGRGEGQQNGQQRRGEPDRRPERSHGDQPSSGTGKGPGSWPKWTIWLLVGVVAAAFLVPSLWPSDSGETLEYSEWREQVIEGNIVHRGHQQRVRQDHRRVHQRRQVQHHRRRRDAACPTPTAS